MDFFTYLHVNNPPRPLPDLVVDVANATLDDSTIGWCESSSKEVVAEGGRKG